MQPAGITYSEWFATRLIRSRAAIFFAAFCTHWILFLCLTVVVMEIDSDETPICLNALIGPTEALPAELTSFVSMTALDQSAALETNQPAVTPSAQEILLAMSAPAPVSDVSLPDAVSAPETASSKAMAGPAAPALTAAHVSSIHPNAPPNAVTAGSFAVWSGLNLPIRSLKSLTASSFRSEFLRGLCDTRFRISMALFLGVMDKGNAFPGLFGAFFLSQTDRCGSRSRLSVQTRTCKIG